VNYDLSEKNVNHGLPFFAVVAIFRHLCDKNGKMRVMGNVSAAAGEGAQRS
jgi:hypothetical protein